MKLNYVKNKRVRHPYLTYREMRFAISWPLCVGNAKAAALMAGYSPKWARMQGYRLTHYLSVKIFMLWIHQRDLFLSEYPKAPIDLVSPTFEVLKRWLAVYGIRVHWIDVLKIELHPPTFDLGFLDNKHDKDFAEHIVPKLTFYKNGRLVTVINDGNERRIIVH